MNFWAGHWSDGFKRTMLLKVIRQVLIGLAVVASVWAAPAGAAERFTSVIDDLPLMAGLNEVGDGVSFSTDEGRIAEVTAQGAVTRKAVLAFYARTLPQLGWRARGNERYVREGEALELIVQKTAPGTLSVRFTLAPVYK